MKILFHLSSCSTCQRIVKELDGQLHEFDLQDIKSEKITESQLEKMAALSGSYEALFSRKAMKYRSMGLGDKDLSESDYKQYILDEYTFLKRPVFIIGEEIFIGNSKKTIEAVKEKLSKQD